MRATQGKSASAVASAHRLVEAAVLASPSDVRLQVEYAYLLQRAERLGDALAVLRATNAYAPHQQGFPYEQAQLLCAGGRHRAAIEPARLAHQIYARPETAVLLATVLLGTDLQAAEDVLTEVAELQPARLLNVDLVDAAMSSGRQDWLLELWLRYDRPDRPAYQAKLRAFVASGL